jgi:hypothetical protein
LHSAALEETEILRHLIFGNSDGEGDLTIVRVLGQSGYGWREGITRCIIIPSVGPKLIGVLVAVAMAVNTVVVKAPSLLGLLRTSLIASADVVVMLPVWNGEKTQNGEFALDVWGLNNGVELEIAGEKSPLSDS